LLAACKFRQKSCSGGTKRNPLGTFAKQKRPFRGNGLASNDCLPYEKEVEVLVASPLCLHHESKIEARHPLYKPSFGGIWYRNRQNEMMKRLIIRGFIENDL